jgi:hypothetical protein
MQQLEEYEFAPRRADLPKLHPIRFGFATLLLMFGALLARISHACTALGMIWAGDVMVRALAKAFVHTRETQPLSMHAPNWERQLLRIGPSIVLGAGGALVMLWALLGIGGALLWLVLHGFRLLLMLFAVLIGTVVGGRRARVARHLPPRDRAN